MSQTLEQDFRIHHQKGTIFKGGNDKFLLRIKFKFLTFTVKRSIRHNRKDIPFIWCLVPKVGSTSWIELFVKVRYSQGFVKGEERLFCDLKGD